MIAPRKVLWSTPDAVIERIADLVDLTKTATDDDEDTVVVDLGCGDGKVLLRWAELYTSAAAANANANNSRDDANTKARPIVTFIGIDIDPNRIRGAQQAWQRAVSEQRIADANIVRGQFHCANAVVDVHLWKDKATVVYCYLTPRGMRQIRPLLTSSSRRRQAELVVVSYMNELPNAVLQRKELVSVQSGTAWPLYLFTLPPDTV